MQPKELLTQAGFRYSCRVKQPALKGAAAGVQAPHQTAPPISGIWELSADYCFVRAGEMLSCPASLPAEPGMLCTPCVVRVAATHPRSPPPLFIPPWNFRAPKPPPSPPVCLAPSLLTSDILREGHYRFLLSHPAPRAVVKPSAPLLNHVRHQPPLSPHPTYQRSHAAHHTATECHTVSLPWPSSTHLNATPQLSPPPRQLMFPVACFMLRPSVPEQHTHPPPAALSTGAPPLPCPHPTIALPTPTPSLSQRCRLQRGRSSPALATPPAFPLSVPLSVSLCHSNPHSVRPLHTSGSCLAAPHARLRMRRRACALHSHMHLCNPRPTQFTPAQFTQLLILVTPPSKAFNPAFIHSPGTHWRHVCPGPPS